MAEMPEKALPTANRSEVARLARQVTETPEQTRHLVDVLDDALVPALLAASRASAGAEVTPPRAQALVTLLLEGAPNAAEAFIERLRRGGLAVDAVHLDLLAPAARRLGAMWAVDEIPFTDVTRALWRLQRIVSALSPDLVDDAPVRDRSCLLAPVSASQHTFGLVIVADFFRRAGWFVAGGPTVKDTEVTALVQARRFDVVGLSIGIARDLDDLRRVVEEVRRASRNAAVKVIVGGPLAACHPERLDVGADGFAANAVDAVALAERLARADDA